MREIEPEGNSLSRHYILRFPALHEYHRTARNSVHILPAQEPGNGDFALALSAPLANGAMIIRRAHWHHTAAGCKAIIRKPDDLMIADRIGHYSGRIDRRW